MYNFNYFHPVMSDISFHIKIVLFQKMSAYFRLKLNFFQEACDLTYRF